MSATPCVFLRLYMVFIHFTVGGSAKLRLFEERYLQAMQRVKAFAPVAVDKLMLPEDQVPEEARLGFGREEVSPPPALFSVCR